MNQKRVHVLLEQVEGDEEKEEGNISTPPPSLPPPYDLILHSQQSTTKHTFIPSCSEFPGQVLLTSIRSQTELAIRSVHRHVVSTHAHSFAKTKIQVTNSRILYTGILITIT